MERARPPARQGKGARGVSVVECRHRYCKLFPVPTPDRRNAMGADRDLRLAYVQFLDFGRRMAAAGHFEVAYHALMAAVHAAEATEDTTRLAEVAALLRQMKGIIDDI